MLSKKSKVEDAPSLKENLNQSTGYISSSQQERMC